MGHRLSFLTAGSIAASVAAQRLELNVLHDLTGIAPFAVPVREVRRVLTIHDLVSYAQPGSNNYLDDLGPQTLAAADRSEDGRGHDGERHDQARRDPVPRRP